MTREEFQAKWKLGSKSGESWVSWRNGVMIGEEITADFESVMTSHDEGVLNTNQAGAMTGYSRAQLLRLYKQGKLRGHKKGKNVFFRAGGLPRKPHGGPRAVRPGAVATDERARDGARHLAKRLGIRESR